MSYEITPEQRVMKDGVDVGFIYGGTCYTNSPPKGRGIPSFRAMAGNADLQFKALLNSESVSESESITETIEATPLTPEPPRSAVLGDRDPVWQAWFIDTYGAKAFSAKWPNRKLP